MEIESVVVRYCEKCKKNTRQRVKFISFSKIQTKCLEVDEQHMRCGYIHRFTLSHVGKYPFESMEPFTRIDLGIVAKKKQE